MAGMRALVWMLLLTGCGEVVPNVPGDGGPTCTSAAECTDPAAPFCVAGQCQAACASEADCTDPASPVCAADGACVGCEANDQCAADAPVCDATERACRGCTEDSECDGGLCIEADGTCVADADAVFVTQMGTDAGACTREAPCATIPFAIEQLGARQVIHVLGGSLATGPLVITGDLVLDGEDTTLQAGSNQTAITVRAPADIIVENFRINAPPSPIGSPPIPGVQVTGPLARTVLHQMVIDGNGAIPVRGVSGAELVLARSHIGNLSANTSNTVVCENSQLHVDRTEFETSKIQDNNTSCQAVVTRSRFESSRDGSVQLSAGQLVMENNLIIHRDGFNDSILARSMQPGSTIRFNTIVNTTALPSDGAALACDNSIEVTSNVFAYNSGHPINGQGCTTRFSVFDDVSTTSAGTGNQVTAIDAIFVDRGAGDYHLAPDSVAREGAEPGQTMVEVDFDGAPRPNPAGTTSDCGAFEAP